MSSTSSASLAEVRFKPSVRMLQALTWIHLLAACAIIAIFPDRPMPILSLTMLLSVSWLFSRRATALGFGPLAIQRLIARADGSWWGSRADGLEGLVQILPDSVVLSSLVILQLRWADQKVSTRLIIMPSASEHADFRGACPLESMRRLRQQLILTKGQKGQMSGNPDVQ